MQVACSFSKGHGIHPITAGEVLHEAGGLLHGRPPGLGFFAGEVQRAAQMPAGIEQEPTGERGWIGMMPQQPKRSATDFVVLPRCGVGMGVADTAAGHNPLLMVMPLWHWCRARWMREDPHYCQPAP